jgi:hypothetical protein
MGRAVGQSSRLAGVLECVSERLLTERLAACATDERKLAGRTGIERALQDGQDWDVDRDFALAFSVRSTITLTTDPSG